jgi:small nuclear ribonucleoprotein (snRNP)-like protein
MKPRRTPYGLVIADSSVVTHESPPIDSHDTRPIDEEVAQKISLYTNTEKYKEARILNRYSPSIASSFFSGVGETISKIDSWMDNMMERVYTTDSTHIHDDTKEKEYDPGVKEAIQAQIESNPAYSKDFDWVRSRGEFRSQRNKIIHEKVKAFKKEDSWTFGNYVAEFVGSLFDPVNLVIGGASVGVIKGISSVAKYGPGVATSFANAINAIAGKEVMRYEGLAAGLGNWVTHPVTQKAGQVASSAAKTGGAFALFTYTSENLKEAIEIPVGDIGSDVILSGIIGASLGAIGKFVGPKIREAISKNRNRISNQFKEGVINDFRNAEIRFEEGANGLEPIINGERLNSYGLQTLNNIIPKKMQKVINFREHTNPTVRALTSDNPVIRNVGNALFKHQYIGDSGFKSKYKTDQPITEISTPLESQLIQYNGLKAVCQDDIQKGLKLFLRENRANTKEDFYKLLHHAGITGDESQSEIVSGVMRNVRSHMNVLLDDAVRYKTFEDIPEIAFDISYMPRMFDREVIQSSQLTAERIIKEALIKQNRFESEEELNKVVRDVLDNILNVPDEIPMLNRIQKSAMVIHGRELNVATEDVFDLLVHDPFRLMDVYFNGLGFEVSQKRILSELGFKNYEEVIKSARDAYGAVITDTQIDELKFLSNLPKYISGQYNKELKINLGESGTNRLASSTINFLEAWNVMTLLGKIPLSVLEDLAIGASRRGLFRYIGEMARGMFGNLHVRFKEKDLRSMGIACDAILGSNRILTTPHRSSKVSSKFMKYTGFPYVNDFSQRVNYSISAFDLVENILSEKAFETRLTKSSINNIRKQLKEHMTRFEDGTIDLNTSAWRDRRAKMDFFSEVNRMIRQIILEPGAGDSNAFSRSPVYRMLTLFTGFDRAITNNILLPLYKAKKFGPLVNLFVYGYAFGLLREYIQGILTNNKYDWDDPTLYSNTIRRLPGGAFQFLAEPIVAVAGGELHRLDINDSILNLVKGGAFRPITELMDRSVRMARKAHANKQQNETDLRKFIGLIPFSNMFYLQPIIDFFVMSELVEEMNLKPYKKRAEKNKKRKQKQEDY